MPLTIVGFVEDQNLLEITWNQRFLDKAKTEFSLKHKEAILFVNKARDRFRLVACFYSMAVLILPPTDLENRLSIYLKVSQFLRKFSMFSGLESRLEEEIPRIRERIKHRKLLAEKAILKRKGEKS